MAAVTWNPADKHASISLSGGNLVATSAAGSGTANAGVRTTAPIAAAAKVYFEITFTSPATAKYFSAGVMSGTASLTANMAGSNGAGYLNKMASATASLIYLNGTAVSNTQYPALVSGQVLRVAVDRTAGKAWWAINNQTWTGSSIWMGSGGSNENPATGVGGVNISAITGSIFPGVSSAWTGDVATFNGGAAGFAYAIPAGFAALDGGAIDDLAGNLAPAVSFAADITVVAAGAYGPDESVYPATSAAEGNAPSLLTLGSQIGILSNGRITHIRYWKASGMQPSRNVSIWDDAGILLFNAVSTGVPGWNLHEISPPLAVSVGDIIRVSYGYSGSGADGNFGFTNSAVWADTANLDFISGCYQPGSADSFPGIIVTDSNYYADIVYQQQLDVVVDLAGGLAPSLAFGADLTVVSAGDGHLYWRFTLDATQPGFGGYTLAEVQFRTAIGVPLTPTGGTPSAADTYPGLTVGPPGIDPRGTYDAAKACDGNVTTMWSSNGPPAPVQWWAYTYATPQDIVEFAITARGDGFALYTQTPVKITPQWSDDGVTWTSWPQLISDNWTFEGQTQVFRNPAVSYVDLAGNLSPSVTLAADLALTRDLVGDLAPAVSFVADISVASIAYVDFAGSLTLSPVLAAGLTVVIDTANYVDFSGNLGGVSQYGKLKYGRKRYSRIDAFAPAFVADLDIVGQDYFNGDLRPVVSFAGALSITIPLGAADIAPIVTFDGDLAFDVIVDGGIVSQVTFAASMTLDLVLEGDDLPLQIDLAVSSLISGPLWAGSEPCPSPPWTPTEPCPPSMWTPVPPPAFMPPSGGWTKQEEVDDLPVWVDAAQ